MKTISVDLLLKTLMTNYFWQGLNSNLNFNQIPMTESLHYCPLHINHDFNRVAWLLIHFVFISLQIWREYHKDKDCISAVIPVCLIMILQWNCAINLLITLQAGLKLLSVFVCYIPSIFVPVNYLTNRFHVAVRLFSNRWQMTSKCGKNKKVAHEA